MRRYLALVMVLAGLGLPLSAQPTDRADLREQLGRLKSDPQQFARLQASLEAFRNLPPERQEALRQLDRDVLHADPIARPYLEQAMERYADWLVRLPAADRESVVTAADRKTRLQRIGAIRERQWLARQPKADRERIDKADPKLRPELIRQLRAEERDRHADWTIITRHWDLLLRNPAALPSRLDLLPEGTKDYVERELRPVLSRENEKKLDAAEGSWPRLPRLLVELADDHPPSLLGPVGPTRISEIPQPVQDFLVKERMPQLRGFKDKLKQAEGKWPDFGLVLREASDKLKPFRRDPRDAPMITKRLMPAEPRAFPPEVQEFIASKLQPALDDQERTRLRATEGVWPAYPRTVLDLSRKHNLRVPPGKPLPGPPQYWDRYRRRPTSAAESLPFRRVNPLALGP